MIKDLEHEIRKKEETIMDMEDIMKEKQYHLKLKND